MTQGSTDEIETAIMSVLESSLDEQDTVKSSQELDSLKKLVEAIQRGHSIVSSPSWAELAARAEKTWLAQQKAYLTSELRSASEAFDGDFDVDDCKTFNETWSTAQPFVSLPDAEFLTAWLTGLDMKLHRLSVLVTSDTDATLLAFLTSYLSVAEVGFFVLCM